MPQLLRFRSLTVAALALALAVPGAPVRGQVPFPIPIAPDPIFLIVPLVLTVLGLGVEMSKSDADRVRQLESRGDWDQVEALVNARLARNPDDPQWRELRGRMLQRRGRCADALDDLRFAFERRQAAGDPAATGAAYDVGLLLGLCQMALWDLPAAIATMTRLTEIAPERWEPHYHLGVARARQGDAECAQAEVTALRSLNAAMAEALATYLANSTSGRRDAAAGAAHATASGQRASAPPSSGTLPATLGPDGRPLATLEPDGRLAVGDRSLMLPAGPWELAAAMRQVVFAATFRGVTKVDPVPLVTAYAYQPGAQGIATAVAFTANPARAYGRSYWSADADCAAPGALHSDRFHSAIDQPECLLVRRVDAAAALSVPQLEPALRAAQDAGLALPAHAYLVHYRRHGMDWVGGATFLLPWDRVVGDVAAVQWGLALAAELRPLAQRPGPRMARTPVLGPA
jgi:hypothetical protein